MIKLPLSLSCCQATLLWYIYQLSWYNIIIIVCTFPFMVVGFLFILCRMLCLTLKLNRLPLGRQFPMAPAAPAQSAILDQFLFSSLRGTDTFTFISC